MAPRGTEATYQREPVSYLPKLLKLVGGGPGGHMGAGGKVPPRAGEESFTTSGGEGREERSQLTRTKGNTQAQVRGNPIVG